MCRQLVCIAEVVFYITYCLVNYVRSHFAITLLNLKYYLIIIPIIVFKILQRFYVFFLIIFVHYLVLDLEIFEMTQYFVLQIP